MARAERDNEQRSYMAYVTDCLAAWVGADTRWIDNVIPAPDYDADAVIDDIAARSGLEVIE